jgi:hypothetical protein
MGIGFRLQEKLRQPGIILHGGVRKHRKVIVGKPAVCVYSGAEKFLSNAGVSPLKREAEWQTVIFSGSVRIGSSLAPAS